MAKIKRCSETQSLENKDGSVQQQGGNGYFLRVFKYHTRKQGRVFSIYYNISLEKKSNFNLSGLSCQDINLMKSLDESKRLT